MREKYEISPEARAWTLFDDRRIQLLSSFQILIDIGIGADQLLAEIEGTQSALDQILKLNCARRG